LSEDISSAESEDKVSPGNRFQNLLFVTCTEILKKNIGESETKQITGLLQQYKGSALVDLPPFEKAEEAAAALRKHLKTTTRGVVILGGYDVIPSLQLNVLSDALLKEIEDDDGNSREEWDIDDFIIWSDDIYGDVEGDLLPEIPVSRIPDGKSPGLLMTALKAPLPKIADKYGVRNIKRPFAEEVFETIPFTETKFLEVSEDCSPKTVNTKSLRGALYFMLHGHDADATRFTGELQAKTGYYEAFDIYNIPDDCRETVVFSGCCYGALVALPKADRKEPGMKLRSRTNEQSIALAFLKAGVNAFVGCTGAHYSPRLTHENFFGKPMHISFWNGIRNGLPPALALLEAKKEYATNIPHGLTKAIYKAIEIKILHQFTCLGLGW
jgi:hypothetical protein